MTFKRGVKLNPSQVNDQRPNKGAVRRTGPTSAPKPAPKKSSGGGKKTYR